MRIRFLFFAASFFTVSCSPESSDQFDESRTVVEKGENRSYSSDSFLGRWKCVQYLKLSGSSFSTEELQANLSKSAFIYEDGRCRFTFLSSSGVAASLSCEVDALEIYSRVYREHDVNAHLKASTRWYGLGADRDTVYFLAVRCPNDEVHMEVVAQDTLSYFYDGYAFLYVR